MTNNHHIVQCNPRLWDLQRFLADGHTLAEIVCWNVTRRYAGVTAGHDIALVVSGGTGVVGLYTATGTAFFGTGGVLLPYWRDPADRVSRFQVPMRLDVSILDTPVSRDELARTGVFSDNLLFTCPNQGNLIPATDKQWMAIQRLVIKKLAVAA